MSEDVNDQPSDTGIKPIAIVLPQFHPIAENNEWWGDGFTEWTNVVKGTPRFRGHYQPHLPRDLGYYDMRLSETRHAQAEMAQRHGVHGFCYYHYWFNGRRILERPVDGLIRDRSPDFPFMLCWANENWTRNWDGGYHKVLLEQQYDVSDFVAHARHLVQYFSDSRYIRIDGRPVFAIYKDADIPELARCIDAFRSELRRLGFDVFLCRFERRRGTDQDRARAYQLFDAGVEFQPLTRQFDRLAARVAAVGAMRKFAHGVANRLRRGTGQPGRPLDMIYSYREAMENDLAFDFQEKRPIFPGANPGWDNSVRRRDQSAIVFDGATPELFETWVRAKVQMTDWDLLPARFLFVNAWNEWAEGNHLEPCECWDTQFLQALARACRC
jgi:lipopolysaccharide biosynthesis protein